MRADCPVLDSSVLWYVRFVLLQLESDGPMTKDAVNSICKLQPRPGLKKSQQSADSQLDSPNCEKRKEKKKKYKSLELDSLLWRTVLVGFLVRLSLSRLAYVEFFTSLPQPDHQHTLTQPQIESSQPWRHHWDQPLRPAIKRTDPEHFTNLELQSSPQQ